MVLFGKQIGSRYRRIRCECSSLFNWFGGMVDINKHSNSYDAISFIGGSYLFY